MDGDHGRHESEFFLKKGETEKNAADCMGGDELCLVSSLYLIVYLVLRSQRRHAPTLLTSSDNGKNSIKLIN